MGAPTILEYLQQGTHATDITLTTSASTPVNSWIVAIHMSEWDFDHRQAAPRGSITQWNIIADTMITSVVSRIRVWAAQVTVPGAQAITVSPAVNDGDTDNHLRVYVLDTLDLDLVTFDFDFDTPATSTFTAEALNIGADTALWLAIYAGGLSPGNYSGIPGDMTSRGELDGTYLSSLLLERTGTGTIGTKSVTFSAPDTFAVTMMIALTNTNYTPATSAVASSSRWGAQLLTTAPANTLLDVPRWLGQRASTFSFELVDGVNGELKGFLNPVRNRVPRLSHDSSRTISRSVELTFTPSDTIKFDPLRDRVLISMWLSDGTTWPLGRYMSTDKTTLIITSGDMATVQLVDEMFIVDQKLSSGFLPESFLNAGASIYEAIIELLRPTGLPIDIEFSPFNTFSSWDIGISRMSALKNLCVEGGYLMPWMGNDGRMKIIRSFDPLTRIPSTDIDTNSRAFRDSIAKTDDLLNAANQFVVVSNSGLEAGPVVGIYTIPANAPHSVENRGFIIPDVYDVVAQTPAQAVTIAETIAQQQVIFERVELDTPIDPRHDGFDVVRWAGENWLELAWIMELVEGGSMSHTLQKVYT
jgi:hypothetical protein